MTAQAIPTDPSALDAFLTSPEFASLVKELDGMTLWHLSGLLPDEQDRRSVASMHQVLGEEWGWLYGQCDASGVRMVKVVFPAASWDNGLWWEPENAVVVFSDGTRLAEDLSDLVDDALTTLAANERPGDLHDEYVLMVPTSEAGPGSAA
ncbi:hypothetical protein [Kitasatospora griseola]|uniref:hypothetical protein n=1 Tax=Kitasatospora griseola TaxID=2064 RepID=UPI0034129A7E